MIEKNKLYKAIKLATIAHQGQFRKGKNPAPYIVHPVFVAMELLRLGYNDDTVIAGILHDLLEDTSVSREQIKKEFGKKVLNLIESVSEPKSPSMTKEEKRKTWETRKKAKLEKLKSTSPEARAIAIVDLLSNMMELKDTFEQEGQDAIKYFNVDLSRKINHILTELQVFAEDKEHPHIILIPKIKEILKYLKKFCDGK